jgi:hypothetical protein
MSIDYVASRKNIPLADLLPRLAPFGITEMPTKDKKEYAVLLTDGVNGGLWAYKGEDGMLFSMTCYMSNGNPGRVLGAIRQAFDTQIAIFDGEKIEVDLAGDPWRG